MAIKRKNQELVGAVVIHKAGTGLLSQLFLNMGYSVIGKGIAPTEYNCCSVPWKTKEQELLDNAKPNTVYFTHLLPAPVGDDIQYRPLLEKWVDRDFPLIFMHRDPRDVLISFINYVLNRTSSGEFSKTPFTAVYSSMLRNISSQHERISIAIECLHNYFERHYRDHYWLLHHHEVLKLNYESLVGKNGGGDENIQLETVRKIAELLGNKKPVSNLLSGLYNKKSRTFHTGQAKAYLPEFSKDNISLFNKRYGDILEIYGYNK